MHPVECSDFSGSLDSETREGATGPPARSSHVGRSGGGTRRNPTSRKRRSQEAKECAFGLVVGDVIRTVWGGPKEFSVGCKQEPRPLGGSGSRT